MKNLVALLLLFVSISAQASTYSRELYKCVFQKNNLIYSLRFFSDNDSCAQHEVTGGVLVEAGTTSTLFQNVQMKTEYFCKDRAEFEFEPGEVYIAEVERENMKGTLYIHHQGKSLDSYPLICSYY